jgi:DNA-binding NarL/FixJ family response regulator
MLYSPGEQHQTELFNDWCVPFRLCDALGMGIQIDDHPLPAGVHFYHETESGRLFGDRGVALLRLLLPAFRSGVNTALRLGRVRSSLGALIDQFPTGLGLFDLGGGRIHVNPAFDALVRAPANGGLHLSADRIVARVAARFRQGARRQPLKSDVESLQKPVTAVIRAQEGQYRLSGALFEFAECDEPLVSVLIEKLETGPTTSEALVARYQLTRRQLEVAMLLASGLSNQEVANRLGISRHTAERHTEAVLGKLGVRSRAAVASAIRNV